MPISVAPGGRRREQRRLRQRTAAGQRLQPAAIGSAAFCGPRGRTAEAANARGRPSLFKTSVADVICRRLADGETLRAICSNPAMPAKATVMRWLAQHPEFRDRYARAREVQADVLAEEVIDIADDRV